MKNICLIILCLFVFSCTETRTEKQTQVVRSNDMHLSGSFSLPLGEQGAFVPLPFDFTLKHSGEESQEEKGQQETKINAAAIGQQLGETAAAAIKSAIAGATGVRLSESKAGGGILSTETGLAGGLAASAAWALREMLNNKNREKILDQVKRERKEAQDKALEYAEKVEPKQLNKNHDHG